MACRSQSARMPPSITKFGWAGQMRALALTTVKRSEARPDLPLVADFVPCYEPSETGGAGAPEGTPLEIIQKLNVEINAGLADPDVTSRYAALGRSRRRGVRITISAYDLSAIWWTSGAAGLPSRKSAVVGSSER